MARPKIDIDPDKVEDLASYGCTNVEIAAFFGCDESVIRSRFPESLTKGRESGKIRLRQKQMKVALAGNVSMLIWLGKQMLGQSDQQTIKANVSANLSLSDLKDSYKKATNGASRQSTKPKK